MVEIDPQNAIVIDQNLTNNSAFYRRSLKEWLQLTTSAIQSLESLYWGGAPW